MSFCCDHKRVISPPQAPVACPPAESLAGLEPAAEPRVALAEGVGERVQARRPVPLAPARLVAPGAHRRLQRERGICFAKQELGGPGQHVETLPDLWLTHQSRPVRDRALS